VCARCLREGEPPDACRRHRGDLVRAGWLYDESVSRLVHAIKFDGRPGLVRSVAGPLAEAVRAGGARPDLIVAVPLHAARRRERGYDQAARLAEALAAPLGAPFVPGLLERTRATRAQSGLSATTRRQNVRGAFRVARPAGLPGRTVLVVDDVLTTGATLVECMETVRAAGAATRGAVLAWAP
jgi:ComF family protein